MATSNEFDIPVPLQLAYSTLSPLRRKLLSKLPLATMAGPVVSFDGDCMGNAAWLAFHVYYSKHVAVS